MYITPLSTVISVLNHHLHADDTQLFLSIHPSNFHSNSNHSQNALQQISSWTTANRLTLNSSKTEFLLIHPSIHPFVPGSSAHINTKTVKRKYTKTHTHPLSEIKQQLSKILLLSQYSPLLLQPWLYLPRDAMHKRGLCRHAVSVCLCLSLSLCVCVCHVCELCQNE